MVNNKLEPSVLIIILNYKTFDLTLHTIDQIKAINYTNYKILVIDNCSPNESANVLEEHASELDYIFIKNDTNSGYAAGNNIGFRYAYEHKFDLSLVLNNDLEIEDNDFLAKLVKKINENENIACVGPQIYSPDGSIIAPYIRRPSLFEMTVGLPIYYKKRVKYIGKNIEVYRIYGCCMLLRTSALHDVKYFDERTFLYEEENILAEKFIDKGYKTWYLGSVPIIHLGGASTEKKTKQQIKNNLKIVKESSNIYLKHYRNFGALKRGFYNWFITIRAWL